MRESRSFLNVSADDLLVWRRCCIQSAACAVVAATLGCGELEAAGASRGPSAGAGCVCLTAGLLAVLLFVRL